MEDACHKPIKDIVEELGTDLSNGLSENQVRKLRLIYGENGNF